MTALAASLVVQGTLHKVLAAATNSRFSLKTFAGEIGRVEGPVYFYRPAISQIVYHARRHIHRIPVGDPPTRRYFVVATDRQFVELRSTYPVREVAAAEGRVGESGCERVHLLSIDGN